MRGQLRMVAARTKASVAEQWQRQGRKAWQRWREHGGRVDEEGSGGDGGGEVRYVGSDTRRLCSSGLYIQALNHDLADIERTQVKDCNGLGIIQCPIVGP